MIKLELPFLALLLCQLAFISDKSSGVFLNVHVIQYIGLFFMCRSKNDRGIKKIIIVTKTKENMELRRAQRKICEALAPLECEFRPYTYKLDPDCCRQNVAYFSVGDKPIIKNAYGYIFMLDSKGRGKNVNIIGNIVMEETQQAVIRTARELRQRVVDKCYRCLREDLFKVESVECASCETLLCMSCVVKTCTQYGEDMVRRCPNFNCAQDNFVVVPRQIFKADDPEEALRFFKFLLINDIVDHGPDVNKDVCKEVHAVKNVFDVLISDLFPDHAKVQIVNAVQEITDRNEAGALLIRNLSTPMITNTEVLRFIIEVDHRMCFSRISLEEPTETSTENQS